jgi:hypothetical protein
MSNEIVILIDCWSGSFDPITLRDKLYNNILNATSNIDPCLVVLASYNTAELTDQNLQNNNLYFKNFKEVFIDTRLDTVPVRYSDRVTDNIILDAKFKCMQIALEELWQLDHVVQNLKQDITKIWMFGLHWNMCIKDRPVGWKSLYTHAKQNWNNDVEIWSREDCTLILPYNDLGETLDYETWPEFEYDRLTACKHYGNGNWKLML